MPRDGGSRLTKVTTGHQRLSSLLLTTQAPSPQQPVVAVALGIALPLSFFSDVLTFSGMPDWMGTRHSVLPAVVSARSHHR